MNIDLCHLIQFKYRLMEKFMNFKYWNNYTFRMTISNIYSNYLNKEGKNFQTQ